MKKLSLNLKGFKKNGGFTLIEILVVIGIIAILAAIVIIAINPAKQFAQARNTQRTANVNAILNAVGQRIADNKGIFEGKFTINGTSFYCPKLVNGSILSTKEDPFTTPIPSSGKLGCLVPTYISSLPTDPKWISGDNTLYNIVIDKDCDGNDASGRISVSAPSSTGETAIPDATTICVVR